MNDVTSSQSPVASWTARADAAASLARDLAALGIDTDARPGVLDVLAFARRRKYSSSRSRPRETAGRRASRVSTSATPGP